MQICYQLPMELQDAESCSYVSLYWNYKVISNYLALGYKIEKAN